jgi:hypothetical protein
MATSLIAMIDGLWLQFMLNPRSADRRHAVAACLGMVQQFFGKVGKAGRAPRRRFLRT